MSENFKPQVQSGPFGSFFAANARKKRLKLHNGIPRELYSSDGQECLLESLAQYQEAARSQMDWNVLRAGIPTYRISDIRKREALNSKWSFCPWQTDRLSTAYENFNALGVEIATDAFGRDADLVALLASITDTNGDDRWDDLPSETVNFRGFEISARAAWSAQKHIAQLNALKYGERRAGVTIKRIQTEAEPYLDGAIGFHVASVLTSFEAACSSFITTEGRVKVASDETVSLSEAHERICDVINGRNETEIGINCVSIEDADDAVKTGAPLSTVYANLNNWNRIPQTDRRTYDLLADKLPHDESEEPHLPAGMRNREEESRYHSWNTLAFTERSRFQASYRLWLYHNIPVIGGCCGTDDWHVRDAVKEIEEDHHRRQSIRESSVDNWQTL